MANVLAADIIDPGEVTPDLIDQYELIGFGSGIYNRTFHPDLFGLIDRLAMQDHKAAFVFATSTSVWSAVFGPLTKKLAQKGFRILGQFSCKGFMDYGIFRYVFGGLNKGRPNSRDLTNAAAFARTLRETFLQQSLTDESEVPH